MTRRATREHQRPLVLRDRPRRPRAGRRQERLARRDGLPPHRPRRAGARRVRDDGRRLPPLHRRDGPGRADHRAARRPRHRRRTPAGRGRPRDPRGRRAAGVPRRPRGRHPRGLRHARRRQSGDEASFAVRSSATAEDLPDASLRRPAGDLPQRARHRRGAARRPRGLRLASTTTARSPTACTTASPTPTSGCRPACRRWCAPTSAPPASCSRWTPSRASPTPSSSPRPGASARASCRARSTPTSSTSTSPRCAPAGPRSSSAGVGAKPTKMVYTDDPTVGRTTEFVDVEPAAVARCCR